MTAPVLIQPDWPAPAGVGAASTLRRGGASLGPYAGLNLGAHVGDDPERVAENRRRLRLALNLPAEPVWLTQVHGKRTVRAEAPDQLVADAAYTRECGVVCAVLTADCLPVLLAARDGSCVAAVHAGWRGLAAGVIEAAVAAMACDDLLAWLGPAIGPEAFEVGEDVRAAFLGKSAEFAAGFRATLHGHWLADLYRLAGITLQRAGVSSIHGGGWCTHGNAADFYSYRRDGVTGRMATLIWRKY